MHEYVNEITPFLDSVMDKTVAGDIHWKKINPTTYYWIKNVESGRVRTTIQRVDGPNGDYYRFDVKETERGEELISLDTREAEDIADLVANLYLAVEDYAAYSRTKRTDILRELIEN